MVLIYRNISKTYAVGNVNANNVIYNTPPINEC